MIKKQKTFLLTILCLFTLSSCSLKDIYVKESQVIPEFAGNEKELSIYFIGDAGIPSSEIQEPVLAAMQNDAAKNNAGNKTIFFLGDNLYESGMPEPDASSRKESERRINEQAKVIVESGSHGFFVPGNHDWDQGNSTGLETWLRQEKYIIEKYSPNIKALPSGGCPGPEILDYGNTLRLIVLDTQWLLTKEHNRAGLSAKCQNITEEEVFRKLAEGIKNAEGRKVIVVTHHPMQSNGPHGGFFSWKDHIFPLTTEWKWFYLPLPVIGSLHPLMRVAGALEQDLSGPEYKKMRKDFDAIFAANPPQAMISGHEHSLEVLRAEENYLIFVSGGGSSSKIRTVTKEDNTLFAYAHAGYMRLDVSKSGKIRMAVIVPSEDSTPKEVYSILLN